jgi:hypothetical protein
MTGKPDRDNEKTNVKSIAQQTIEWFFQDGIVKRKQQAQNKEWACVQGWLGVQGRATTDDAEHKKGRSQKQATSEKDKNNPQQGAFCKR